MPRLERDLCRNCKALDYGFFPITLCHTSSPDSVWNSTSPPHSFIMRDATRHSIPDVALVSPLQPVLPNDLQSNQRGTRVSLSDPCLGHALLDLARKSCQPRSIPLSGSCRRDHQAVIRDSRVRRASARVDMLQTPGTIQTISKSQTTLYRFALQASSATSQMADGRSSGAVGRQATGHHPRVAGTRGGRIRTGGRSAVSPCRSGG